MTKINSPKAEPATSRSTDWREATLSRIRTLIKQADPEVVEERKWVKPSNPEGVPTWYRNGIVCTGETYKTHVKVTFAKGASLSDPSHLFNSSLEGNLRRAIDFHEGETIDEKAFKALVREAVALNAEPGPVGRGARPPGRTAGTTPTRTRTRKPSATRPEAV